MTFTKEMDSGTVKVLEELYIWIVIVGLLVGCGLLQVYGLHQTLAPNLFGQKQNSMFDMWSPGHVMLGVVLGGICHGLHTVGKHPPWFSSWLTMFMLAVAWWEAFEFCNELGLQSEFAYTFHLKGMWFHDWLAGYEHWTNRCIGDPLCAIIGCMIWRRFPRCFWPVVGVGIVYEVLNLAAPTATTFQSWMFGV